jgi:membrane-associated phospholipid phosphatase
MNRPVLSAAFLIAFVVLGNVVSHRPPSGVDLAAYAALYGHGVPVAVVFTQLGRFPEYAALCALALVFGIVRRAWLARALTSIVVLLGAWRISDAYKDHFMRARPEHQLVFQEPTFSFASGHAALALTFYGGWALLAWRTDLPRRARIGIVTAAGSVVLAISWSRLALGAHYLTDVVGGLLLGATFVTVLDTVTRARTDELRNPFAR